ncbi:EAL domain-containing protein [Rhodoferax sp. AJA081-3]|uniref:bifunctional diguanylate cyclase/phosphodiesterase n=1 Tax=Rhodoferax sp. AJA081-3 TaxID=2752316 RepID=UPI001ADED9D4|nr:EAL domain-containing protein [Rhodoferax sp. AJA081-3]QTN29581.1 EAL domain-containing protein [Rhodoferax sp. AJA081-3]
MSTPQASAQPHDGSPKVVALIVFVLAALASGTYVWTLEQRNTASERMRMEAMASDHAHDIQTTMERALSATYSIAAMVRQGKGHVPDFEGVAAEMLPWYPGVAILGLSPGGVIRRVAPLEGNEKSIGFNQLTDPKQGREARMARDTGKLTLAGPLKLVQGGLGAVGRLPIFLDDADGKPVFWGLTYAVIRFPQALTNVRLHQMAENGIAYSLWRINPDTGVRETIAGSETVPPSPVERSLTVPNGQWTLSVAPVRGWGDTSGLILKSAIALVFSLMLAYASKLLVKLKAHERGQESLIAQRTLEIAASQNKLKATLEAIPDVMLEMGLDGTYHDYHAPRSNTSFPPAEFFLGKKVTDVLPPDAARAVMAALQEANEQGHSEGREFALETSKGNYWFEISLTRKQGTTNGETRFIVLSRNVTQRKSSEEEINKLAFYDPLTNLPNRRLMVDRLRQALAISSRSGFIGALQFIDLDNFKTLNDTQGHDMGDLLLQQVAKRLTACMRQGDTVARLGGDEFVVMIEELSENREEAAAQAEMIGEKILAAISVPYKLAGLDYQITPSIGITLYSDHQQSTDELLKQADLAMYQSKSAGRNTLRFFDPAMQAVITTRVKMENDIRQGILKGEFVLYYQPQINREGRTVGAEVLLRWPHPIRGMVSPAEFIPLAEDTGLILPLGNWVLETACTQLALWAKNTHMQHLTLAVNVSARQFRQPDFVEYVLDLISYTGVDPKRLKLELTESLLVNDIEETTLKMTALKARGVGFSLDDFGTGYSSLSYLKRLPLDQLKIDQSFVRDLMTDPNDAAIALAVITLGHALGLTVIAEGVETQAQRDHLHSQGCDAYQGYLLGRPMPLQDFESRLLAL